MTHRRGTAARRAASARASGLGSACYNPWHQERAIADLAPGTLDNGNILQDVRPEQARRIHLVGVAGTGMGSFAGMLKAAGYEVTGSDENVYPPMSDMLAAWGIEVLTPVRAGEPRPARSPTWSSSATSSAG